MSTRQKKRTAPSRRSSTSAASRPPHLPPEIFDSLYSPDAVMVVNPDGTVGAVNHAALDLLGYSADDLIGQPIGRFFAERKKERKKALARAAREAATGGVEATLITNADERIPVALLGSMVLDALARSLAIVHVARSGPISPPPPLPTESRAHLNQLLDITPDAIIVLDEDQRILTFNRGAEEIFGYRAEEVLGGRIWAESRPAGGVAICFSLPKRCEEGLND